MSGKVTGVPRARRRVAAVYVCPVCGRTFPTASGLVAHFRLSHLDSYTCPCCGFSSPRGRSLARHAAHAIISDPRDACHALVYLAASSGRQRHREHRRLAWVLVSTRYRVETV